MHVEHSVGYSPLQRCEPNSTHVAAIFGVREGRIHRPREVISSIYPREKNRDRGSGKMRSSAWPPVYNLKAIIGRQQTCCRFVITHAVSTGKQTRNRARQHPTDPPTYAKCNLCPVTLATHSLAKNRVSIIRMRNSSNSGFRAVSTAPPGFIDIHQRECLLCHRKSAGRLRSTDVFARTMIGHADMPMPPCKQPDNRQTALRSWCIGYIALNKPSALAPVSTGGKYLD